MGVCEASPENRGYRDPERALRALRLALVVQALTSVLELLYLASILYVVSRAETVERPHVEVLFSLLGPLQFADVLFWFVLLGAFTWWVRMTVVNSRAMHRDTVRSRHWSGLWLAVPIAHLWMPFLVAVDLWRATHRQDLAGMPRRAGTGIPPLILAWWAAFAGSTGWTYVSPVVRSFAHDFGMDPVAAISLLVAHIGLVQLFLMYRVARAISGAQRSQRSGYRVEPDMLPPRRAET